ncbi:MAG TPA: DUF86 domain-containing protein [Chitinophagales bacterium]|nr:DUF86 domain-containing protein [Chitinophagales bacterium]HRK27289.1 DUF86 domain-containing protein [Chitinophagales bacterium]
MRGNKPGDKLRLQHILQALTNLEDWLQNKHYEEFAKNIILLNAVCRQLEIIGEAANNLYSAMRTQYSEIPWAKIVALRNLLIHEYFGVIPSMLWQIIQKDLPPFKEQINKMLENFA